MTDRELLELAAKAAGYALTKGSSGYREFLCKGGVEWNPLDDDGDALRLAVRLDIQITPPAHKSRGVWAIWNKHHRSTDPYSETRRAIVRAAADIGRSMA